MKKLIFFLIAGSLSAQRLQPIVGIHYTGGFTYGMDEQLFSAKTGLLYTFKEKKTNIINSIEVSGNIYYNFFPKWTKKSYTFYNFKIQASRPISEWWNVVAYGGYVNNFQNNVMKPYRGNFKTNLSYGGGFQAFDDYIVGEILYESLAGYSNLSVGVTYKFKTITNKQ